MKRMSTRIEPFQGTVNVRFKSAVLASTDAALKVSETGRPDLFFIPYPHISFDFLEEHDGDGAESEHLLRYWRVSAVGEAADKALLSYDAPPVGLGELRGHAAFDPEIVTVEAMETPDPAHKVHWPD